MENKLMRYALKVYYDGLDFSGSQRQPEKRTVEGEFLTALANLGIDYENFKSAGRTDRGVSSFGNVFAISSSSKILKPRVINTALPPDIRVLAIERLKESFNPRYAEERVYKYFLLNRNYDLGLINDAAKLFAGKNSFHNFSSTDYRNPIREIREIEVKPEGDLLVITFHGKSFLWQMVRRIVTALKMAGSNDLSLKEIKTLLDPSIRRKVSPSDGHNLVLWNVRYNFEFSLEEYTIKILRQSLEESNDRLKIEAAISRYLLEEVYPTS